ncbi:hypothetical protein SAMN02982929_05559 [Saccharopolyspora kobensis]|uniref:DUF1963 domain-containing protein n=1 Tax=Saccharopolyspora kobensis TaxID=146035 RepID=A0A1H6E4A7_9PSEU|nr:hypothetical protein [Saccharopolyspora kobensis]SEG92427.1 hypothetical protein SAMN02982929_05559 [Saccharopolyspora kobensis]SFD37680.1 hypothetical protein SAMN05216506_10488 [Saccharopolyspora kobensis]
MGVLEEVERIVLGSELSVPEKEARVIARLVDSGVPAAAECLVATSDSRVASFVAVYLEMVPGAEAEKTRAAERLRGTTGDLVRAASRLVRWLPGSLLDAYVQDYLATPEPNSPLSSVLFSIAVHHPERVRPYADRIESPSVQRILLSGAPDEVADRLFTRWHESRDLDHLHDLALIRTEHAADLIQSLESDRALMRDWDWLMPLAGRLPYAGAPAGFRPAFAGFVADAGASPHVMGGVPAGDVPLCADCGAPAERVLTLSARDLPHALTRDPSFYWFTCGCLEVDRIVVGLTSNGVHVHFGPQGPGGSDRCVVPGERSMVLEPHPNQIGFSLPAIAGRSRHQVGGLPHWPSPETHPHCPGCGDFMPFLIAIDSGPTPFGAMGFEPLLFGFWCDPCAVSATQIQF